MATLSKRLDSNTNFSGATSSVLQRRLVLSKVKAAEKLVGDTLSEIKIHIDNIENVIRFKKEECEKKKHNKKETEVGEENVYSILEHKRDEAMALNLVKLENAVNNLVNAFKQIQQLHEEMKALSKEYGISLADQERAINGVGLGFRSIVGEDKEGDAEGSAD